jgi:hypothetical protein
MANPRASTCPLSSRCSVLESVSTGAEEQRSRRNGSRTVLTGCSPVKGYTGWAPELTIQQGVVATLRYLTNGPWLLEGPA